MRETKEMLQPCLIYLQVISLVARRVARSGRHTAVHNADTLSHVQLARLLTRERRVQHDGSVGSRRHSHRLVHVPLWPGPTARHLHHHAQALSET